MCTKAVSDDLPTIINYRRGVPQLSKWIIVEVCPAHLVVKTVSLYRLPIICPSTARFYRVSSSSDVVGDDLPTITN